MAFLLNSNNVLDYLAQAGLWSQDRTRSEQIKSCEETPEPLSGQAAVQITTQAGKNFNLRVAAPGVDLLVKQEPHGLRGKPTGEIAREWAFYRMLADDVGLGLIQRVVPRPLHFDATNAIIVMPYWDGAWDLGEFYEACCTAAIAEEGAVILPVPVAIALGKSFALLHSQTFEALDCYTYWQASTSAADMPAPNFLSGLERLSPEEFCGIPSDALKFFRFYQRYPEIGEAIAAINQSFAPSCIVHDDPRFANVLVNYPPGAFKLKDLEDGDLEDGDLEDGDLEDIESTTDLCAYLIDWEKWKWGDPAYDVGRLVANYLKLWLKSLPISSQMPISEALNQAAVPLSAVQPSLAALMKTYLKGFPDILDEHPDFVVRVTQFAGLGLIQQVLLYIVQKRSLGNVEMAFVQVAKSLLCQPAALVTTVFGEPEETIIARMTTQVSPSRQEVSP